MRDLLHHDYADLGGGIGKYVKVALYNAQITLTVSSAFYKLLNERSVKVLFTFFVTEMHSPLEFGLTSQFTCF